MLHLIERNKGGRNLNGIAEEGVNWKAIFKASEDSLTSSVFGHLFYLPLEMLWDIISKASYDPKIFPYPGRLTDYEFWPRWSTEQNSKKEPDIFIRFENFDLIIEAKRFDYDQQSQAQWTEELNSYYNEFGDDGKSVFLLALGGIKKGDESSVRLSINSNTSVMIIKCRWFRILNELLSVQEQLIKCRYVLNSNDAINNIIRDIILAFRVHGFQTGKLLKTMPVDRRLRYGMIDFLEILKR